MVNTYRREWANERNYFWQVAWRIPSLKPGTAVLAGYLPSTVVPDYDASFALALLYADKPTGSQLPYWYYTWDGMQTINLKMDAKADKPIVLRVSGGTSILKELSNEDITVSIDDCIRLNVSAMALSIFVGSEFEKETLVSLAKLVDEGEKYGIPVLAVTAVGKDMARDVRYLGLSCRIGGSPIFFVGIMALQTFLQFLLSLLLRLSFCLFDLCLSLLLCPIVIFRVPPTHI